MMDISLLKDPVFMFIGISNIFGMAGLYVPFVFLVDAAKVDVSLSTKKTLQMFSNFNFLIFFHKGIDQQSASFLISIIGITNTFGRILCGYVADFPWVNSLLLNNICLVISTIAVSATPFCNSYPAYMVMAVFFGIAVCKDKFSLMF